MREARLALAWTAVVVSSLGACSSDDPLAAVEQFQRAAEQGARAEVFALLGPVTKARLEADAHKAADLSGRRNVRPEELLAIGWSPRRFRTVELRLRGRAGDHAEVEAEGEHGEREVLQLVKSESHWKIELP